MSQNFQPGELVWAKLYDYPFWPARVASDAVTQELREFKGKNGIGVLFFGFELSYGFVGENCIKSFEENYEAYKKARISAVLREEFEAALDMAKNSMDIEDPPLELSEEERVLLEKERKNSKNSASEEETVPADNKAEEKAQSDVAMQEIAPKDIELPADDLKSVGANPMATESSNAKDGQVVE